MAVLGAIALTVLMVAGCSNNNAPDQVSLTVDLGYNPASLFDTLDNVQVQLVPNGLEGQVVTVDLGPNASRTVFGGLKPGFYNVIAVGIKNGIPIAHGENDNILVTVGFENETFVVVQLPQ